MGRGMGRGMSSLARTSLGGACGWVPREAGWGGKLGAVPQASRVTVVNPHAAGCSQSTMRPQRFTAAEAEAYKRGNESHDGVPLPPRG